MLETVVLTTFFLFLDQISADFVCYIMVSSFKITLFLCLT